MSTGETWTLGHQFERRPNALNLLRLVFAAAVVVGHAAMLAGHAPYPRHILGNLPVDGFFAISGFLICRSWERRPQLGAFLWARAARILPGLWMCVAVTAFVIAPLVSAPSPSAQAGYVLGHLIPGGGVAGIEGGPAGVPVPGVWNGSLWTLGWEVFAYLALAALGLLGLLRRRIIVAGFVALWAWSLAATLAGYTSPTSEMVAAAPRLGLMFACGMLLWLYRERIPVDGRLAAACAAVVVVAIVLTPNYRLLAALPFAYLCLSVALALGRFPRLVLRNDLSYGIYIYGFPIQQALVMAGASTVAFSLVSLACVAPIAALSWFLIERPAMRWRSANAERPVARLDGAPLHDPPPARQP